MKEVCKLKDKRGLRVRDLRLVNLALLAKWRWRLITGDPGHWRDILVTSRGGNRLSRARLCQA